VGRDAEQAETVRTTLRELLPHVAESLSLPGNADTSSLLGVSEDDLRQFALDGLTRRLEISQTGRKSHSEGDRADFGPQQKPRPSGAFPEPSDGLEPSTPSLPWKCSTS
jgi:hypothetical protein